jgi:hypothetical protein
MVNTYDDLTGETPLASSDRGKDSPSSLREEMKAREKAQENEPSGK